MSNRDETMSIATHMSDEDSQLLVLDASALAEENIFSNSGT